MNVRDMRQALIERYSARIRGQAVYDMPDYQVIAIYRSMINREGVPKKDRKKPRIKYEQLRMDI